VALPHRRKVGCKVDPRSSHRQPHHL